MSNIKKLRKEKRKDSNIKGEFTCSYMARKLNISESYYSLIENNKRRLTLEMAASIASIFEVPISDLILSNDLTDCKVNNEESATSESA
jgi:transcriptional regulator with XRE-family HTH domain